MKRAVVAGVTVLGMELAPAALLAQMQVEDPSPAPATTAAQPETSEGHLVGRFVRDVGGDYVHFLSWDTAVWLSAGGGGALLVHAADDALHEKAESGDFPILTGGAEWGSQYLQIPLAIGWWIAGAAAGSANGAAAGRDMLRAQISAASWSTAMKYAIGRTRPNGDPRSFPSGHTTTAFATAMSLQVHYGAKLGVPAFAIATYTAWSRVTANHHWASDVVFGAALGMTCARTVTVHLRGRPVTVQPVTVPGGGALMFTTTRWPS